MPNVFLARHGETTWNVAGRYQGRLESELSAKGAAQALALAGAMSEFEVIKVSRRTFLGMMGAAGLVLAVGCKPQAPAAAAPSGVLVSSDIPVVTGPSS